MSEEPTTILYFGGSGLAIEDYMIKHLEKFKNAGVLLSYWNLKSEGGKTYRRLRALLKEDQGEDQT